MFQKPFLYVMMLFLTGTGLECVWGRWAGPELVSGESTGCTSSVRGVTAVALIGLRWKWNSSAKRTRKKGGSARASPVAVRMPKSDSS